MSALSICILLIPLALFITKGIENNARKRFLKAGDQTSAQALMPYRRYLFAIFGIGLVLFVVAPLLLVKYVSFDTNTLVLIMIALLTMFGYWFLQRAKNKGYPTDFLRTISLFMMIFFSVLMLYVYFFTWALADIH